MTDRDKFIALLKDFKIPSFQHEPDIEIFILRYRDGMSYKGVIGKFHFDENGTYIMEEELYIKRPENK